MSDFFGTYFFYRRGDSVAVILRKTLVLLALLVILVSLLILLLSRGRIEVPETADAVMTFAEARISPAFGAVG